MIGLLLFFEENILRKLQSRKRLLFHQMFVFHFILLSTKLLKIFKNLMPGWAKRSSTAINQRCTNKRQTKKNRKMWTPFSIKVSNSITRLRRKTFKQTEFECTLVKHSVYFVGDIYSAWTAHEFEFKYLNNPFFN